MKLLVLVQYGEMNELLRPEYQQFAFVLIAFSINLRLPKELVPIPFVL